MDDPKKSDSILIPKIEPENTVPTETVKENGAIDPPIPKDPPAAKSKGKINWRKVSIGVAAFIVFLLIAIGVPAFLTYQKGLALYASAKKLSDSVKSQDLGQIKTNLGATKTSLAGFKSSYILLSWTRIIPFAGSYVSDLGHAINAAQSGLDAGDVVLTAIEPYADLLGFKGGQVQAASTGFFILVVKLPKTRVFSQ